MAKDSQSHELRGHRPITRIVREVCAADVQTIAKTMDEHIFDEDLKFDKLLKEVMEKDNDPPKPAKRVSRTPKSKVPKNYRERHKYKK